MQEVRHSIRLEQVDSWGVVATYAGYLSRSLAESLHSLCDAVHYFRSESNCCSSYNSPLPRCSPTSTLVSVQAGADLVLLRTKPHQHTCFSCSKGSDTDDVFLSCHTRRVAEREAISMMGCALKVNALLKLLYLKNVSPFVVRYSQHVS